MRYLTLQILVPFQAKFWEIVKSSHETRSFSDFSFLQNGPSLAEEAFQLCHPLKGLRIVGKIAKCFP